MLFDWVNLSSVALGKERSWFKVLSRMPLSCSPVRYVYAHGKISTKVFVASTGKGSTLASKTLKGLAAKGLLAWPGSSQNDPSQFYALPH